LNGRGVQRLLAYLRSEESRTNPRELSGGIEESALFGHSASRRIEWIGEHRDYVIRDRN